MALTTYSELKTSIADFLNRDDLASVVPTFIDLAHAKINRDIRHYKMENRASGQISGGDRFMQVPADWRETIRLKLAGGKGALELLSLADIADKQADENDLAGTPMGYAHVDGQFELHPTPSEDTDFELLYIQDIPALSDSNASNWLLSDHPDVYLYGALIHSAPYLQEDARTAVWAQLYSAAVQNVNMESDKARHSGVGLRLKVRGLG